MHFIEIQRCEMSVVGGQARSCEVPTLQLFSLPLLGSTGTHFPQPFGALGKIAIVRPVAEVAVHALGSRTSVYVSVCMYVGEHGLLYVLFSVAARSAYWHWLASPH